VRWTVSTSVVYGTRSRGRGIDIQLEDLAEDVDPKADVALSVSVTGREDNVTAFGANEARLRKRFGTRFTVDVSEAGWLRGTSTSEQVRGFYPVDR
jgi:hypothetical protein